jgi:hypothetical protein
MQGATDGNYQEIKERIAIFARELAEELGEVDDGNALSWLDALETQAVAIGDAVSVELLRQKSLDRAAAADESTCAHCGQQGQYQGQRQRVDRPARGARHQRKGTRVAAQRRRVAAPRTTGAHKTDAFQTELQWHFRSGTTEEGGPPRGGGASGWRWNLPARLSVYL